MESGFPTTSFLEIKQEIIADRNSLESEKAVWAAVRKPLSSAHIQSLDEQFKEVFEKLGPVFPNTPAKLQPILQSLGDLVQQGASARLLGNDELGSYNLAMVIQQLSQITGKETLAIAAKIIRLTIVAGADLNTQKAYAGNGGAIGLEWLCLYLAGGIGEDRNLRSMDQYECCYKILPWILEKETSTHAEKQLNPFITFIACLRNSPDTAGLQEKVMLMMMYFGYASYAPGAIYQSDSSFNRVAAINIEWLTLLFPFEEEHLQHYLHAMQTHLSKEMIPHLVNSFTSSNKGRKHFKAFFSLRPHWLLRTIISTSPEMIFRLVARNERALLAPFLRHFKPAMAALRDEKGHTLLHQAMHGKGRASNTLRLLSEHLEK
ncbi:MAG TPA: hypothetical protein VGE90_13150 [Chitinophaga sp.]